MLSSAVCMGLAHQVFKPCHRSCNVSNFSGHSCWLVNLFCCSTTRENVKTLYYWSPVYCVKSIWWATSPQFRGSNMQRIFVIVTAYESQVIWNYWQLDSLFWILWWEPLACSVSHMYALFFVGNSNPNWNQRFFSIRFIIISWCYNMGMLSSVVRGNPWWPVDSYQKGPVIQSFDVLFIMNMNKLFTKQFLVIWDVMRRPCNVVASNIRCHENSALITCAKNVNNVCFRIWMRVKLNFIKLKF